MLQQTINLVHTGLRDAASFSLSFSLGEQQVGRKVLIYSRGASTTVKSGWRNSEELLAGLTVLAPRKQSMPVLSNANNRRHLSQFIVCA